MTAVRVLILSLLLAGQLAAQSTANHTLDSNKITAAELPSASVPMTIAAQPQRSKPERVFDKKFFAVMGSLGAAESLRFTTRKLVLDREFDAGAPWVTSVPSNRGIIAKDLALYSSEFLVAYELKKRHSWLPGNRVIRQFWWAYPLAMTTIHVKNAIGNIRTQGPGGCTSVECALQTQ
ncbi:MAG: hypothetical protein WAM78_02760 [Candidatus Sulfotelmatobacter sp.]